MDLPRTQDLAAAALELLDEGHVGVRWDGELVVVVVAVVDGRAGRAEGSGDVERLVRTARLRAQQARAWPAPALPEPHNGAVADCGRGVIEAVANSRGLRAAQSYAPAPAQLEGSRSLHVRQPAAADVAGPNVVAEAIAELRSAFGVGLALAGAPPHFAEAITLIDDSSVGVPRAYDVEGVPRKKVVLVERGAFVGGVHDSASAEPSTGHATRALTLAPRADNLVLAAGEADLGPGALHSVDLADVIEVGSERTLVALRGGGCALVPAVRVRT